jgi:uncharacterized protein YlzI (FlbEa/FlbD family)
MSNQLKRSSPSRIGNSNKRHRKNSDDNCVVYISNLAESVDVKCLEDFLIDRFGLAYKKDLEIDLCIVRNRFDDAVVKCTNGTDFRRLLRLKSRNLFGNTMEFFQWSSKFGDIDDFFNDVPSTRRTRERCHFKRKCGILQRGPEVCKYFHTREEIAHYHPYYYGDGDSDGDGGTDVREEVPEGNHVLHITNVIGAVNDQQLSKFLMGRFKTVFKHDLKIVRCRVRQNFNDATIECENKDDCSLLLTLKSRRFKKHIMKISRLPSSIHDIDDNGNDNNAINTTDTWISIDQNQAIESEYTASQNATEIVNSPDTKIAENSDDKSAMLLKDQETQKLLNEDTTSQNVTEIEHNPDITTDISNGKHEMLLIDEKPQKLQNEDTTRQNNTEIEDTPDTTTDISNGKHEVMLGDDEENKKLQNEDIMKSQNTAEIEHTPDTMADISNDKHEVISGNDEENQNLQNEDMTNRKTSIDNTPDTTEKVLNDKHAIILGEYETLKLQHEAVIKQKFELSSENEDLKVKHEDTSSKYTKLKKFLSHSKVDQANIVSLKRENVELNQRNNKLTDTICDVMEEKRGVVSRLEKKEQAFDEKKSELRKQLDARLESEVSIRQEAERVFDREKSELRKQLENAQRFSDCGISELRKQFQDEKRDIIKRLENEASLRQEAEKKLQDTEQNFDKESSHHEQEISKLKKQLKDEIRGHRDAKQAFLQEKYSFHKQLDTEISMRQEAEQLFYKEKSVLRQELDAEISRHQKAEKLFHQKKSELRNQLDKEIRKRKEEEERNDQLMTTYSQLKKERGEAPTDRCSTGVKEEETS